jgi:hypothetical protein
MGRVCYGEEGLRRHLKSIPVTQCGKAIGGMERRNIEAYGDALQITILRVLACVYSAVLLRFAD